MVPVSDEDLDRLVQLGHVTRRLGECSEDELQMAVVDAEDRRQRSNEALAHLRRVLDEAVDRLQEAIG